MKYLLEICVDSLTSVKEAALGGADRIELCSALELGGLSPSIALVKRARSLFPNLEIVAMVRPRAGDFCYTTDEFEVMLEEIKLLKNERCHSIVTGILNSDGTIDTLRMQQIIEAALPMSVVFHRAIDVAKNPIEGLEVLVRNGLKRVLTSGQSLLAIDGVRVIQDMQSHFKDRLEVLIGSGVTLDNVEHLLNETGCHQVHMSAKRPRLSLMQTDFVTKAQAAFAYQTIDTADRHIVEAVKEKLNLMSEV